MPDTPRLRALLARRALQLRLVSDPDALDAGWDERRIRWVHSSDLTDPTPFLTEDLVLLTTGTQFTGRHPADPTAYVERLAARGVLALGFGTEVVREGVPEPLVAACRVARMPLFEVPYRTPFIAVARANAEALAAETYARRTWALAAQRAIAVAALRPDGLSATLSELAARLGAWVGRHDAAAGWVDAFPRPLTPRLTAELDREARALLGRGTSGSAVVTIDGRGFTLQTIGRGGRLRGVVAIGATALDPEARGVVTTVVAMAGLALEQSRDIHAAEETLRSGVLQALRDGATPLARRLAAPRWGALPAAPLQVVVYAADDTEREPIAEWLERRAQATEGASFWGPAEEGGVVLASASDPLLPEELAERFAVRVAVAEADGENDLAGAEQRARVLLARGEPGLIRFAAGGASLLDRLRTDDARTIARARIEPLRRHDETHATALLPTVASWLAHDGRHDTTAAALGIHRHTVRARLAQAQQLLGVDLASFPARAELWAALAVAE